MLALVLAAASLAAGAAEQAPPVALFRPSASIQELMDSVIDPAADAIWDSVATVETATGTEERQPRTPEEWLAVRRHAITLIEGTNLLVIPGRRVAHGYLASEGPGVSDSRAVQASIDRSPQRFADLAHGLHAAASEVLRAVDAKDAQALLAAGGRVDAACERCHSTFWYPGQRLPGLPKTR